MKLRLYAFRNLSTGLPVPDLFFPDKKAARAYRAELGANAYCVTYGPDHRLFKG